MTLEYRFDHRGNVELQPGNQRRSFCGLYFLVFILLQAGAVAWLYFSGYLTPVDSENSIQAVSLRGKMNEQERILEQQAEQLLKLESQVTSARRSEQIQSTANNNLREKLGALETALAESRQRLLLYDEILSPQALEKGLSIQHLGIKQLFIDRQGKKLAHDRYYQYHLVLTNVRGAATAVKGRFKLGLYGKLGKKNKTLTLSEIIVNDSLEKPAEFVNKFSLKHYQGLEGIIELPEGFIPERVIVELSPASGAAGSKVKKQYNWQSFESSSKPTVGEE